MRNVTIVESNVEPNKEHLWFYNGKLKWFGPNGWEEINPQVPSPTTTPPPVVTTTTTSTPPPTFKLTNNIGDTLNIMGLGYVDGEITSLYPIILNGGSVIVLKSNEEIVLYPNSYQKLSIMVDGENRGELESNNSTGYRIPQSIFINATEIIVYVAGVTTTTTTTSKPNVK